MARVLVHPLTASVEHSLCHGEARHGASQADATLAADVTQALELSELCRCLMRHGLRERHPEASEAHLQALFVERIELCRKRSF